MTGERSSSASLIRVLLVGTRRTRAGLADTGTLHQSACEGHGRVLAGRAQDEQHHAEKDGPDPHGSLDAFGERERGCHRDEERCERAVQATPSRSARR